jgi:hypothetical protein
MGSSGDVIPSPSQPKDHKHKHKEHKHKHKSKHKHKEKRREDTNQETVAGIVAEGARTRIRDAVDSEPESGEIYTPDPAPDAVSKHAGEETATLPSKRHKANDDALQQEELIPVDDLPPVGALQHDDSSRRHAR